MQCGDHLSHLGTMQSIVVEDVKDHVPHRNNNRGVTVDHVYLPLKPAIIEVGNVGLPYGFHRIQYLDALARCLLKFCPSAWLVAPAIRLVKFPDFGKKL